MWADRKDPGGLFCLMRSEAPTQHYEPYTTGSVTGLDQMRLLGRVIGRGRPSNETYWKLPHFSARRARNINGTIPQMLYVLIPKTPS